MSHSSLGLHDSYISLHPHVIPCLYENTIIITLIITIHNNMHRIIIQIMIS